MENLAIFSAYLKQVPFLTEADCQFFTRFLGEQVYQKAKLFLEPGRICHHIGFVCKGVFRVYYLADGKEVNTRFILENDFVVDYDSFSNQKPSKYYIEALEPAELIVFTLPTLISAYDHSHNWERFGRLIAERAYRETITRVESFLFMEAEERYLQLITEHSSYLERIPLYHLASYLGIERESLSRIRKKIAHSERL